jgi:hypothetical protein
MEFEISYQDMERYYKKLLSNNIFFKRYVFIIAFVLSILMSVGTKRSQYSSTSYKNGISTTTTTYANYWVDVLICYAVLVGIIFLVRFRSIRSLKKQITDNPCNIGKREIEFTDNKVILSANYRKSEYHLYLFKNMEEDSDFYYLFWNKNKEPVIIIPKRNVTDNSLIQNLKIELDKERPLAAP